MAYLLDNPPARPQYRTPRREPVSGLIVLHDAENLTDVNPPDTGAEAVANFIRDRSDAGSYHDLCDSDSTVNLLPYDYEAFQDATGSNPHAIAVSGAFRLSQWATLPEWWRAGCVEQMAQACVQAAQWVYATRGIVIPARRVTRAESETRTPGFITHAERDPDRRHDPGDDCANRVVARYAQLTATPPPPNPRRNTMIVVQAPGSSAVWLIQGGRRIMLSSPAEVDGCLQMTGQPAPMGWSETTISRVPIAQQGIHSTLPTPVSGTVNCT